MTKSDEIYTEQEMEDAIKEAKQEIFRDLDIWFEGGDFSFPEDALRLLKQKHLHPITNKDISTASP